MVLCSGPWCQSYVLYESTFNLQEGIVFYTEWKLSHNVESRILKDVTVHKELTSVVRWNNFASYEFNC